MERRGRGEDGSAAGFGREGKGAGDATRSGKIGRRLERADSLVTVCFRARSPAGLRLFGAGGVDGDGRREDRARAWTERDLDRFGFRRSPSAETRRVAPRVGAGATRPAEVATRVGATRPLAARWRAPTTGAAADTVHADMFYRA
mmetsp:Transcript_2698/g.10560  ORF Transcript_2698/g.10560 Transcript_2698/m.10560 type:complete len:145 (-) Transcript_2698:98-532(-)